MKVLLCCIGKCENQYIREFVEHYKIIGFDNIWLYDNNDPDGERFEDVIGDYIDSGFVVLKDYRGRKVCQLQAYNECYKEAGNDYDWIAFFDCDEFLTLTKKKNIHHVLQLSKYKGFDAIHVNWKGYGDGDIVYNDGKALRQRIVTPLPLDFKKLYQFPENFHVKSIVRTGIPSVLFGEKTWSHTPEGLKKCCDTSGKQVDGDSPFCPMNYEEMSLDHYSTKTTEEYISKVKKGFPDRIAEGAAFYELMVKMYFLVNKKTPEKVALFERELGIKVSSKRTDVQIFMLCYSPKEYGFIDNSIITPLQCGAAVSGYDVCELKDNQGADNVSAMNRFYVENSGTYWIWKNIHNAKYIGQMQYGRRLKISENDDFDAIFAEYDAIVAKPYHFEKIDDPSKITNGGTGWIPANTVQDGYAFSHCGRDIAMLEVIVKKAFPDYADDWDKYIKNGNDLIYSAGFVMKNELFQKYCVFLFTCLKSWLLTFHIEKPSDLYIHVMRNLYTGGYIRPEFRDPNKVPTGAIDWQTSLGGFFGERLLTLFIYHNCKNILYTEYEKTEDKPL